MPETSRALDDLRTTNVVLPSLLLCDFGNLAEEVARLEAAGVQAFHLDVMDGQFVPNFTYGMTIVEAMRRLTRRPLDVHLMMHRPEAYIAQFRAAGADVITFHVEAVSDAGAVVDLIHHHGAKAGVAANPGTPYERVEPVLEKCDLFLAMSVEAGFGGQAFNPVALEKLQRARARFGSKLILEVDGGVNAQTIARCRAAGANWFVVGSAIFKAPDYTSAVADLNCRVNAVPTEA